MGRCYNSAVIAAPCVRVWETIRDFQNMSWAAPLITSYEQVGDVPGDRPGSSRVLNGMFHETLESIDPEARTFSYRITDGPEPISKDTVTDYIGTVRLRPITSNDSTFIEWESTFNSPDDSAVAEFCNPIYVALLESLQQRFALE